MPYLIDGHNLIPKIAGLNLGMLDDEMQLIQLLQEFCRLEGKQVEVYFDNAPPGGSRVRVFGPVKAFFVRAGRTADQEIQRRLKRLGRAARNWSVVSSDRQVRASARASGAKMLTSDEFAHALQLILNDAQAESGPDSEVSLSPDELADWLALFGSEGEED